MAPFRLILLSGSSAGTEFPLEKSEIFLGRDLSNDVVINDPEVSRQHIRLVLTGNTYAIEDRGSTNGTFVRGQRLSGPLLLSPGETIILGEKVLLKFESAPIDPNATVAAFRRPPAETSTPVVPVSQPFIPQQPAVPQVPQSYVPQQPATPQYIAPQPVAPQFIPQQPAAPQYASPQPVQQVPAPAQPYHAPAMPKKKSGWLVALLVVVGILLVFCIIPWVLIEITDSYCSLFPGIFNSIQAGACP